MEKTTKIKSSELKDGDVFSRDKVIDPDLVRVVKGDSIFWADGDGSIDETLDMYRGIDEETVYLIRRGKP